MEFLIAIIIIIGCRIIFEYLDIRYRRSVIKSDYWKAFYISKNFRVKNKYEHPTYKAIQQFFKLPYLLPKLFTNWLQH